MTEDARTTPSPSSALQSGSKFHGYTVVRCVGVGGMGAVFEGIHEMLGRRCAIKVLHAKAAEKAESRDRFVREARSVAKIRHPNVVDIFDVGLLGEVPYLVMEFLEGESLENALARLGTMDAQGATTVLLPIAAAISAVHRAGIVHRDVKPDNIFLARDAKGHIVPKLVDFGIAKDLTGPMRGSHHTVVGTPHYMSPEQARGSLTMDARTDQYAFGVMLYQLSTSHLPYDADSLLDLMRAIDAGRPVPLRQWNPELSPEFEAVVLRAMSRDANDRYASMIELGRALMPFASPRLRNIYAADFGMSATVHGDPTTASSELEALSPREPTGRIATGTSTTTTLDDMVGRAPRASLSTPNPDARRTDDSALPARTRTRSTTGSVARRRKRNLGLVATLAVLLIVGIGVSAYLVAAPNEYQASQVPSPMILVAPQAPPPSTPAIGAAPAPSVAPTAPPPMAGAAPAEASPTDPAEASSSRPRSSARRANMSGSTTESAPTEPSIGIRLSR